MKRIIIAVSILGFSIFALGGVKKPASDKEAVVGLLNQMLDAWNKSNFQAMSAYCADDISLTFLSGKKASGKSAVEKLLKQERTSFPKKARLILKDPNVQFIRKDLAVIDASLEHGGDASNEPTHGNRWFAIVSKEKYWSFNHYRTFRQDPAP